MQPNFALALGINHIDSFTIEPEDGDYVGCLISVYSLAHKESVGGAVIGALKWDDSSGTVISIKLSSASLIKSLEHRIYIEIKINVFYLLEPTSRVRTLPAM